MSMNKQGFANIILIVVLVVIVLGGVTGYFILKPKTDGASTSVTSNPALNQEQARSLVLQTWGGCVPDTCSAVTVTVQNSNGQYIVTAIYEGLRDDSVGAQEKVAVASYGNNIWTLGNATVTQRCQVGRGHQDFSSTPCL